MNTELNNYILFSRENKVSDEDIKNNLLSKGWTIKDIEESFFVLSGGDRSQLGYVVQEQRDLKRKNLFSILSFGLFLFTIVSYILTVHVIPVSEVFVGGSVILDFLWAFMGIILGIIGLKSQRRVLASFGIFLNILTLLLLFLILFLALN